MVDGGWCTLRFGFVVLVSASLTSARAAAQERHGAKTVGQIKDFIAKLSGIQAEHQALRIRMLLTVFGPFSPLRHGFAGGLPMMDHAVESGAGAYGTFARTADTNIAERIMEATRRPEFLTMLEHEQSMTRGTSTPQSGGRWPMHPIPRSVYQRHRHGQVQRVH
jgi:hypothetical protein